MPCMVLAWGAEGNFCVSCWMSGLALQPKNRPHAGRGIPSLAGKVHFSALASHTLNLDLTYRGLQGVRA